MGHYWLFIILCALNKSYSYMIALYLFWTFLWEIAPPLVKWDIAWINRSKDEQTVVCPRAQNYEHIFQKILYKHFGNVILYHDSLLVSIYQPGNLRRWKTNKNLHIGKHMQTTKAGNIRREKKGMTLLRMQWVSLLIKGRGSVFKSR